MTERNLSIDLIKIIAMFSIIALHTFGPKSEWSISNIFYETAVIGIPLFYMVSGYLLLGRNTINSKYIVKKIYNILRLIIVLTLIVWTIKFVFSGFISHIGIDRLFYGAFVQEDLFMCWYLASMIIIYIILIPLNKLFINRKDLFFFLFIILLVIEYYVFLRNVCSGGEKNIIQTLRLWNWVAYFMLGGIIKLLPPFQFQDKTHNTVIATISTIILLLVVNICFQEKMKPYIKSIFCEYFYCSFIVCILVSIIFITIVNQKICSKSFQKTIKFIAPLFMPVYILHPFLVNAVFQLPINIKIMPYIAFILVSYLSISIGYCLSNVRLFARIMKI